MPEFSASMKRNQWLQSWAKLGFAVGGVVYLIIGVFAVLVACENRGRIVGPEGAIDRIGAQPYGEVLLAVISVGLLGYAAWCFVQAIFDTDQDGNDLKGVAIRFGEFCSGLAYLSLALLAFHRMRGDKTSGSSAAQWSAKILAHTWGQWVIGLAGIVFAGVGVGLIVYAADEGFRRYLCLQDVSTGARKWIVRLAKCGYSALGIVFSIIGMFLVMAGVHSEPNRVKGLDGALRTLTQQSYGPWILGIVAAGLAAYGMFMLVEARYRRLA
jgi:hypothetical protein